jgi:hypothetical protein
MNGQAIKETIYVLRTTPDAPTQLQPSLDTKCVFELPALAEYVPTDDHFNDQHSVIWFFDELFSDVKIFLQKKIGGAWSDVTELTDDTYGTFYAYGFFTNKFGDQAIGYLIKWTNVLNEEGPGSYRVRVEGTKSIGTFADQYSFEFALKVYTADRADRTVSAMEQVWRIR